MAHGETVKRNSFHRVPVKRMVGESSETAKQMPFHFRGAKIIGVHFRGTKINPVVNPIPVSRLGMAAYAGNRGKGRGRPASGSNLGCTPRFLRANTLNSRFCAASAQPGSWLVCSACMNWVYFVAVCSKWPVPPKNEPRKRRHSPRKRVFVSRGI